MKTFNKIISFFNKLGFLLWLLTLIIKVVNLVNEEVNAKFNKKGEHEKVNLENGKISLNDVEEIAEDVK